MVDLNSLLAGGRAAFETLVSTKATETVELDFKSGRTFKDSLLDQDGRRNLGKELSALSNSAGGLVVFGVECKKDADGVDCAQGLSLIPNVALAETSVQTSLANLIYPHNDGIRVHVVPHENGSGFVIVEVPKSARRPHMAQIEKSYFRRVGTSSVPVDHYDVEDAFRWHTAPELSVDHELTGSDWGTIGGGHELRFTLKVAAANTGGASARHIYLRHGLPANPGILDHSTYTVQPNAQVTDYKGVRTYAFPLDLVIHPGNMRALYSFYFALSWNGEYLQGPAFNGGGVHFTCEVGAEGVPPISTPGRSAAGR